MYQSTYYVDKTTDTFADSLLAFGVATLLDHVLRDNATGCTVRLRDAGGVYTITLEGPMEEGFEEIAWFCDMPFLRAQRKTPPKGWPGEVVDYDAEKERRSDYFEARRLLSPQARRPGATVDEFPELAAVHALAPRSDWDILAQINQMQAIHAYSHALEAWYATRRFFPQMLRLLLKLYSTTPNDVDRALTDWKALKKEYGVTARDQLTPVQILNPSMGKGVNRPKTDRADLLSNPNSFWALEFLKFWGMRVAGLPRLISGSNDRKTYVLRPVNITLETHDRVCAAFGRVMWSNTAIKMDVLAALRYTDVFLDQWLAGQLVDTRWGEEPGDYISALSVTFYKDMGSASAVLNLSTVGLPHWMAVETPEQGRAYRQLIAEQRQIVDSLDEGRSEGYRLLQYYRNFMSARDLTTFFGFTAGYASLTMSRMEQGQWAPRFTTENLEVLMAQVEKRLKPILESPGFRNVAAAIRRSTVIPQGFKARGQKGPYSIRYGLGADLLRRAAYPDQFIQTLSAFLHDYNRETVQIYERYGGNPPVRRAQVTTDDIEQLVELIDAHDSETVANLLVAFGYARESREPESEDSQAEDTSV